MSPAEPTDMDNMGIASFLSHDLTPAFWTPELLNEESAWWGHVPFAFWITAATKPAVVVELGSLRGVSYVAFCETVRRLNLETRCYAVDTWQGDAHVGFYDRSIYTSLKTFHYPRYGSFSTLLRKTFDEAVDDFADGSIDLLHIDGFHTYEAVKHDFETWHNKLSPRAIVLFHDTNVRRDDFGVWRFFDEAKMLGPHFEFLHSHGLGVLALGPEAPEPVLQLCGLKSVEDIATVRSRFAFLGARWVEKTTTIARLKKMRARSFPGLIVSAMRRWQKSVRKTLNDPLRHLRHKDKNKRL